MDIEKMINSGLKNIPKYPFGKPKSAVSAELFKGKIVKINSNENTIGVSPKAIEAAEKILSNLNLYPESKNLELRRKVAQKFQIQPENVFIGNGAGEIIYYAAIAFLNNGDEVIVPEVTYPLYLIAFKMMRANVVKSAMNGYKIDTGKIQELITEKTKMIALCNPNNPTGDIINKDEMFRFIKKIPDDVLLIIDEAYIDFADNNDLLDTVSEIKNGRKNLYVIRTLSKAYGLAGLRIGYGIGDTSINDEMQKIKLPFNISLITQYAAEAALKDDDFLNKTVATIKKERNFLYEELNKMNLNYVKSSTNFILIDVKRDSSDTTLELEKRGIMVRDAAPYGIKNCIRVTIGKRDQNERFLQALSEVLGIKS